MSHNYPTAQVCSMRNHGFTLLELLIAIAIFAIVAVMAMGGYNELITQREHAAESMLRVRTVQRAVTRITQDLMQLEPRPVRDATATTVNPALYPNNIYLLELTRAGWTNPAGLPRATLQRVGYRLMDGKLYRDYWIVLDRSLSNTPIQAELLDNVSTITLRYLDGNRQWQTTWPASSTGGAGISRARATPLAVEITLKLDDWGEIKRIVELPG
ncbi:MAG: type II secretion system minor pseudopilin GspJ [Steroidobacteraceae bacterium]